MASRRESRAPRKLGKIQSPPPQDNNQMTPGEVFIALMVTGGWTYDAITEAIQCKSENDNLGVDTVKGWGIRNNQPTGKHKDALFELIRSHCVGDKYYQPWIDALISSWVRKRINKSPEYANAIRTNVLESPYLTRLPALFETNQSLPLATAYVDLCLASTPSIEANPSLLELNLTLAQRLNRRIDAHYAIRRSPKDCLDGKSRQSTLILGPPGAGKSSMLRRIALEIAERKWDSIHIPLFVEARTYWATRKTNESADLLTFALRHMLPRDENANEALDVLMKQQSSRGQQLILLVDGLDEIATDPSAVDIIYDELRQLTNSVSWIVTARPAGLMSSLGERQRFEVVELDDEAIEKLVDNWCDSTSNSPEKLDKESLKIAIYGSPSTRALARNPFLLTALCFLKSITPERELPSSQISVYESLLERIALQAQRRNPQVLSPEAVDALQAFSFDLYNRPDGRPIQVFELDHWWKFIKQQETTVNVDFRQHILPSRLLAVWGEDDPYYHFLHLSLQEHLVARAMLDHSVTEALSRRFLPGWRAVFRFYGALLWLRGRIDEFRELTQTLYEEEDLNRLSLLTLVDIFSCAGIRETEKWIGSDLRTELYAGSITGFDLGPDAMIYSLAQLDPDRLEDVACAEIDDDLPSIIACLEDEIDIYEGRKFIIRGRDFNCPYEKLARARTSSAKRIISDAFWGENQQRALMSAHAYSAVATPSDRNRIAQATEDVVIFDDMTIRIFAFAQASRRPVFVPFLGRIIEHFSDKADGPHQEALSLIADIGGEKAALIIEHLLETESQRLEEDFNAFEVSLVAAVRMGGDEAVRILKKLAQLPHTSGWHKTIEYYCFGASPVDESALIIALSDRSNFDDIVSALSLAAIYGRIPTDRIVRELRKRISVDSLLNIYDLCFIEAERLDAGRPPILCAQLLEIAKLLYARIHNPDDENDHEYLVTQLLIILDTLGLSSWQPARNFAQTILFENNVNDQLQAGTIGLIGHIFSGTSDTSILKKLTEILFQNDGVNNEDAALAIGRIDLEELYRLQNADGASNALAQIAVEKDILIFEQFWVDRFGKRTEWANPPKKVLFIYDIETSDIPQIFGHEMSRYGFCLDANEPEECIACLVFGSPTEDYEKSLVEQSNRLNQQNTEYSIFTIAKNITENRARAMARKIGTKLASRS